MIDGQLSILKDYLVTGDIQARAFYASIMPMLKNRGIDSLLSEMETYVDGLDYDMAVTCLERIIRASHEEQ